jgi:hypothetical protein
MMLGFSVASFAPNAAAIKGRPSNEMKYGYVRLSTDDQTHIEPDASIEIFFQLVMTGHSVDLAIFSHVAGATSVFSASILRPLPFRRDKL